MRAGRGKANDGISHLHLRPIDNGCLLDDADAETGEIVVVAVVDARHLGGLAADERGTRLAAAFGDAT